MPILSSRSCLTCEVVEEIPEEILIPCFRDADAGESQAHPVSGNQRLARGAPAHKSVGMAELSPSLTAVIPFNRVFLNCSVSLELECSSV